MAQIYNRRIRLGQEKYGSWFEPATLVTDGKLKGTSSAEVGIQDMHGLRKEAVEA